MNQLKMSGVFLNPTILKLGLISLFADIASEMLYPITPIYLSSILGISMVSIGLIEGLAEGVVGILKMYSGVWSDQIRQRKVFIWTGYLMGAVSKPLIGIAITWQGVLFARILDRFGKGIRSAPRDALIADSVEPSLRGEAFGWHRGLDTLGATIGPLLAILLLQTLTELRTIYFVALLPGLISVAIALSLPKEIKTAPVKLQLQKGTLNLYEPIFKKYLIFWGLFTLTNSSDVFLILKAKQNGFSITKSVLLYTFYNLVYAISSPRLGRLSDQIGRKSVLVLGLLIYSIVYFCFGFAHAEWQFWFLFAIYGLYMGATEGISKALAVDLLDANLRATGLGTLGLVSSLTTIVASTAAGYIWEKFGASYTFFYGSAGALLACLGFHFFIKPNRTPKADPNLDPEKG